MPAACQAPRMTSSGRVFVAVFIGTIEILGLIGQEYSLSGGFWDFMGNFDINTAGFVIVGVFVVTWIAALAIWHFGKIEQRYGAREPVAVTDGTTE
jgi:nickel/cobalt transporter (NiCoT) family protein